MKRTNIVLDERAVRQLKKATGIPTLRGVVDYAIREALRHRRQRDLLRLRGRVKWEGDLDEMRRTRSLE